MRSCNFLYFKAKQDSDGAQWSVCLRGYGSGGGDKSTNCWQCLKKGLLEKTVKWWQENILDQSQKKKKIEANQVCSSEKHPSFLTETRIGIARCSSAECGILRGHQGMGPGTTRVSRGRNHGMPGDTVMSYFEKTKQNNKTNLSFLFNWSSCSLKIASVY